MRSEIKIGKSMQDRPITHPVRELPVREPVTLLKLLHYQVDNIINNRAMYDFATRNDLGKKLKGTLARQIDTDVEDLSRAVSGIDFTQSKALAHRVGLTLERFTKPMFGDKEWWGKEVGKRRLYMTDNARALLVCLTQSKN